MSFFKPLVMTKKRFKFQVTLLIDELKDVPFVTGILYCKLRLKNGGTYTNSTKRQNVTDHSVYWRQRFEYSCKLSADPRTGILDSCIVRLSVRKEARGGRSTNKIGYVDLNLAEIAGSGQTSRHCLLESYNDKNRLDNSILKIVVGMQLLSGDSLFKTPTVQRDTALKLPHHSQEFTASEQDNDSSGFGSLPKKSPQHKANDRLDLFEQNPGHSRNASFASHNSRKSDYSSMHSRTPSNLSQTSNSMSTITEIDYPLGTASFTTSPRKLSLQANKFVQPPRRPPPPHAKTMELSQNRMGETRVSADDVVSKLIESQDFTPNAGGSDGDHLQLYVASDGSTALGGRTLHNRVGSGVYQPVVVEMNLPQQNGHCNTWH